MMMSLIPNLELARVGPNGDVTCGKDMSVDVERVVLGVSDRVDRGYCWATRMTVLYERRRVCVSNTPNPLRGTSTTTA